MNPIRNQVLVKPFESDSISTGGIIIPDSCKSVSHKVKIVKTGRGTEEKPMRLKAGQIGFRVKDWGTEIIIEGERYLLMESDAIIALEDVTA